MINLQTSLFPDLTLSSPIGIAASHLTGDEKSLAKIIAQQPDFLTLKSTSMRHGDRGVGNRNFRSLKHVGLSSSFYSFGPYELELLDGERTLELVEYVRRNCLAAKIGVSVLSGENFPALLDVITHPMVDFLEVNLKYFTREHKQAFLADPVSSIGHSLAEIQNVLKTVLEITTVPVLVKLSRDMPWLISQKFVDSLEALSGYRRIGYIIANSRRYIAPVKIDPLDQRAIADVNLEKLYGAISGKVLFPETITMIHEMRALTNAPIVASGGIMTGDDVIWSFVAGANAVQLCTALNERGMGSYQEIKQEAAHLLRVLNLPMLKPEEKETRYGSVE
jgi:dihydroorotate dehydrogenase